MSQNPQSRSDAPACCPYCGAALKSPAAKCWLCHQKPSAGDAVGAADDALRVMERAASRPNSAARGGASAARVQQRLSSLLLILTLVCIIGGITALAPGLGITIIVFSIPALIHTWITSLQYRADGEPMSPGAKVWSFTLGLITAVAVVWLAVMGAIAALAAVCAVSGDNAVFGVPASLAAVASWIGVMIVFLIFYVRRKRRRRG